MSQHQVSIQDQWFHLAYSGEEADDGTKNELSIYPDGADPDRLALLLTNVGFDQRCYDNTCSLTREDAQQLVTYLQRWLKQ